MKDPTRIAHKGRPKDGVRLVNPPTEAGSTVLFPDYESFRAKERPFFYGRAGTPTHWAFEDNLCALENADSAVLTGCGLSAITFAILSVVSEGGHILITDSAYDPTRFFANGFLKKIGIETTYFDPTMGSDIKTLIRPNTQAIMCETPGSLTFEVQDIPGIVKAAGDIPVIVDNTYTAGVYLKPLDHGAAMSVQAITKYIAGHSDLLMGAVLSAPGFTDKVKTTARHLGNSVSAADVTLAHRGLRTLPHRLAVHQENGLALARWLEARSEVEMVLHPGLPSHPQHELWVRDASGTSGLFSAIMNWESEEQTAQFVNALSLFGLGYSWGGYESLCLPAWPASCRSATKWTTKKQLFRFHAGLEDISDLTADLERAFALVG